MDEHSKDLIDRWTAAGLSRYVSLPVICLLGETSSGKSSVLSSLIGLDLPSGSSLTTKCPVLIQVAKKTEKKEDVASGNVAVAAVVDVQWHLVGKAKSGSASSTSSSTTSPHSPRERKRHIEQKLEDRSTIASPHVDEMKVDEPPCPDLPTPPPVWQLRRLDSLEKVLSVIQEAQELILTYRNTTIAPDVVSLTLYSATAERELTLVDLPGLVAYQHTSDASLLTQVEQVVLKYVCNPRSILVPVVAAPTHIHNSKILQWCRTVDPSTARTVPVLTKPDLIDPGSENDVLRLLQGLPPSSDDNASDAETSTSIPTESSTFAHGFYMVKNRGQASLDGGSTIAEGLQEEEVYFSTTAPWNTITRPRRLGIPELRTTLATLLGQLMRDSLPEILQEVEEQCKTAESTLEAWGTVHETRGDQRRFYHSLTQQLVTHVSSYLSGKGARRGTAMTTAGEKPKKPGGAAQLHAACAHFMKEIKRGSLATVSTLVEGALVLVSTAGSSDGIRGELVHIDEENGFCCVDYVDEKDHSTDELFDGIGYTTSEPSVEKDEVWSDGSRIFIGRGEESGKFDSLRKLPLDQVRTDPSWLIRKIAESRTDDLACFINVDMFQHIVAEFVQEDWAPHCHELVQALHAILMESLDTSLKESFGPEDRHPLLRTMIEKRCYEAAKGLMDAARRDVASHLEVEEQHPYTQDEILLEAMNEGRFNNLRRDLELQLRLNQEGVVFDTEAITTILDRVFQKHKRLHWMAEQMELVLSCYGKVATQRVLDRTPQICFQTCRRLPSVLQEELGSVTDDVLETCMWESPEKRLEYQQLVDAAKDLGEAMDAVKSIQHQRYQQ